MNSYLSILSLACDGPQVVEIHAGRRVDGLFIFAKL